MDKRCTYHAVPIFLSMLLALKECLQGRSLRFKIVVGYLLPVGLSAAGLSAGFILGERYLEEPAIIHQKTVSTKLLRLNELQEIVLENRLSLLPYVRDPSQISDSGHRLTAKSQQLRDLLEQADWDHLFASSARNASRANTVQLVRCRQAAVVYDDRLNQLMQDQSLGQVPSQVELVELLNGVDVQGLERCALDLQRLIASAEATQFTATDSLLQARELKKKVAAASLLVSLVIAAGLALHTSGQVTYPLQHASQVAKQVSQENNFDLRVQVIHRDEVGVVADAFNQLLGRVQELLQDQQLIQEQLEQYSAHLESMVAVRTKELTQQNLALENTLGHLQKTQSQLIQAEKMSGLGQMVAGLAHEINNPVNFIHGNLNHAQGYFGDLLDVLDQYQHYYPEPPEALQRTIEDLDLPFLKTDAVALLQSMKTGTQRIREIVLSLRNFSRLDEADLKAVNLHEGIESSLMILGHRLKAKTLKQEIEVVRAYGDLPLVSCHASQINQVFMNILANAIDALDCQHGEDSTTPQIMISTSVELDHPTDVQSQAGQLAQSQSQWAVVTIADNGGGIPLEVQSRLFEPFFTTKPVGKGTGLGLSISYQIVTDHHGGRLLCKSCPQRGTEFQIWLPLSAGEPFVV